MGGGGYASARSPSRTALPVSLPRINSPRIGSREREKFCPVSLQCLSHFRGFHTATDDEMLSNPASNGTPLAGTPRAMSPTSAQFTARVREVEGHIDYSKEARQRKLQEQMTMQDKLQVTPFFTTSL